MGHSEEQSTDRTTTTHDPRERRLRSVPRAPGASRARPLSDVRSPAGSGAHVDVVAGTCVVRARGELGPDAAAARRSAFDTALRLNPARVVVDLVGATTCGPHTVDLLSGARRFLAGRGVALTLTAVPDDVLAALTAAHVGALFDVQPTTAIAVARARVGMRARRSATARSG